MRDNLEERLDEWKSKNPPHNAPSLKTIEMVGDLKTELKVYCQKMEDLSEKVTEGFRTNTEQHREIILTLKESLDKKADKDIVDTIQSTVRYVVVTLVAIIIGALSFLIKETLYK
jgi:hypothetical protein